VQLHLEQLRGHDQRRRHGFGPGRRGGVRHDLGDHRGNGEHARRDDDGACPGEGPGLRLRSEQLPRVHLHRSVEAQPLPDGVTAAQPSRIAPATAVVSTYPLASGTTCTTNGGDCSIYGQNSVEFDAGTVSNPDDGVVGLLYTTGKIAFKNHPASEPPGEGVLYAGSMDLKNGYDILYNSRIERVLGFGTTYERTLWQELNV